ncbi:hypothetical protein [Cuniculiplasma divulgatum]|uniref:Membrane protein n=1 Tax=Cuniculiplasma divulgatum TaxID=1673428 RepID=A0A1R4A780_9ARCH|nr:hypothetical protein [Cuniculiplasma divulgatum]MCI2411895.1 hypothetical protein [Cuniculiplasma sp.]SJK84802.1 membrane protein [Cuniculiplasma divulgatum]
MKRPNPYRNEGDTDINFIMAGAVEFNPSLILLKKIRMNKIEGFFFGLFFTFLSISISILTSNIYYLFLALILFGLSFSSVGLVYIHSELMFSQKYIINAYGLGLIRGKKIYYYHSFNQLRSSVIVHTVKGNLDYYSVLFLPIDLKIKLPENLDQINLERLKKLLHGALENNDNRFTLKTLKRYYAFPYLDLNLAIEVRKYYIRMYEDWSVPDKYFT